MQTGSQKRIVSREALANSTSFYSPTPYFYSPENIELLSSHPAITYVFLLLWSVVSTVMLSILKLSLIESEFYYNLFCQCWLIFNFVRNYILRKRLIKCSVQLNLVYNVVYIGEYPVPNCRGESNDKSGLVKFA